MANCRKGRASERPRRAERRRRFACAPDLKIVLLRGNVGTRLSRVESGEIDATVLAAAGLARLGLEERAAGLLPCSKTFCPPQRRAP